MQRLGSRALLSLLFSIGLATALPGCGSSGTSTTTPSPTLTTDSYSDTVAQLGAAIHPFTVAATGSVQIKLTSVAPLATLALGVGIATWDGANCVAVIAKNDNARSGVVALTGTATAGNYCIRVYDSGNIPDASSVTFSIDVVHP